MMFMKKNGGFTLVELIVVIAILAILAGVAVPAYSGYVEKANKQADITLVSEIEHALTLAGYSGTISKGESGYITLSTTGVTATGANADVAMKAVFGDNYADTLKLKYASWGNNGMLSSLLNSADPQATTQNVMSSPYITGNSVEQLMGEVEDLTTVASGVLAEFFGAGSGNSTNAYNKAESLFKNGDANAFTDVFKNVYGESADKSKLTETELANLMVLASAKEFSESSGTSIGSDVGQLVGTYAMCVAFASTEAGKADANVVAAYKELQTAIMSKDKTGLNYVTDALGEFQRTLGSNPTYSSWMASKEGALAASSAFGSIMSAADSATVVPEDLKNSTLFTEGKGSELFNTYLANAEMISGMTSDQIAALKNSTSSVGSVVVSYSQNAAAVNTANTITGA